MLPVELSRDDPGDFDFGIEQALHYGIVAAVDNEFDITAVCEQLNASGIYGVI